MSQNVKITTTTKTHTTRNVLLQKRIFGRHLRDHYDDDQKEGGRSGQSAGGLGSTIGKFIENCSM